MSECEQWLQEYVFLALRIDKFLKRKARNSFIGHFTGSPEWRSQVEGEPHMLVTDLIQAASDLVNALPRQQFEPQRLAYLQKQAISLQTFCRKLSGEAFSLEEEIKNCLDIEIAWIPETYFQERWDWYDEMLPGQASFPTRLYSWRRQQRLPEQDTDLFPNVIEQITEEIRRRTRSLVDLPPSEGVELHIVRSAPSSCWYLGHYHSRLELNSNPPPSMEMLVRLLCHEGYPGHHTDFSLKEYRLYHQLGYTEQNLSILASPQLVLAEGLALNAHTIIFAPGEIEQWLRERYAENTQKGEKRDNALDLLDTDDNILFGVWCNAVHMLHQGCSLKEVTGYVRKYAKRPVQENDLTFLNDPIERLYVFAYFYGAQLVKQYFQGRNPQAAYRYLLLASTYPSELQRPLL